MAFGLLAASLAATETPADRVLILANRADPGSVRLARHYAQQRGVPHDNIVALEMPLVEGISWREFLAHIWTPLLDRLVEAKWIDAIPMQLADAAGRRKYAPYGHRIAALVVCRGVPLKIAHDPALYAGAPPFTSRHEFQTNAGAVDAELSLLASPNYAIDAFVPNPLFQNEAPGELELAKIVKVARLDGPTVEDAMALVGRAISAERTGLLGRAYVDLSGYDRRGDRWLESAAAQLAALGFDTTVHSEPATIPATARFDAPVLYFGWYTSDVNGPFALPGFRFPPGAIALHIHSYSAATLRQGDRGWTAPFVARGVTATVGNVHEPYLTFTHRPDLLVRALARGNTLVDAAYFALPALSWQAVLIGDPLYRPFAVSPATHDQTPRSLPPRLAGYAVLGRMRQLEERGRRDEALQLARSVQRTAPSLAVGFALAELLRELGDLDAAADALGFAARLQAFETTEWGLARDVARLLVECGNPAGAVAVWETLLRSCEPRRADGARGFPRELKLTWLSEARAAAAAAKDMERALAWEQEHATLAAATGK